MKKILFISHQASLSGAPILLLNILKYLKNKIPYEFLILLVEDGPIKSQFEKLGKVLVYPDIGPSKLVSGISHRLGVGDLMRENTRKKILNDKDIKLIFSNTIINGALIDKINYLKLPIITYVHELEYAIRMQPEGVVEKALQHTTLFLAGSNAVFYQLRSMYIPANKIKVIPSSVPFYELQDTLSKIDTTQVRVELGLQHYDQVVVAVGTVEWRKGYDLFVQMAIQLAVQQPHVHFIWVGAVDNTSGHYCINYDIVHAELTGRFHIILATPHYLRYVAIADVFVLPSREDPFPLVILEAAVAGKPIICFDKSGGSPEFVRAAGGIVVPYGNIVKLTQGVMSFLSNLASTQAHGLKARRLVEEVYNTPVAADQIGKEILEYAS